MKKVLIMEDELNIRSFVVINLKRAGYDAIEAGDGQEALDYARAQQYDGIILDIMMPRKSGLEVLSILRREGNTTPVLLLTAKSEVEDRIAGLDAGADDYLPKPFVMGELLARLRAMLRRREAFTPDVLRLGNLALDQKRFTLYGPGGEFPLGKLEFRMMELFLRNPGMTFSADVLLERVWGLDSSAEVGTVWVYISYLRKKISALNANVGIRSKRSLGYSLEVIA